MQPTSSHAQACASAALPCVRPCSTAAVSGAGKPSAAGRRASAATMPASAEPSSRVLSQLKVYWRTESSSRMHTSMPQSVASHRLCAAAPASQRASGLRHSAAVRRSRARLTGSRPCSQPVGLDTGSVPLRRSRTAAASQASSITVLVPSTPARTRKKFSPFSSISV